MCLRIRRRFVCIVSRHLCPAFCMYPRLLSPRLLVFYQQDRTPDPASTQPPGSGRARGALLASPSTHPPPVIQGYARAVYAPLPSTPTSAHQPRSSAALPANTPARPLSQAPARMWQQRVGGEDVRWEVPSSAHHDSRAEANRWVLNQSLMSSVPGSEAHDGRNRRTPCMCGALPVMLSDAARILHSIPYTSNYRPATASSSKAGHLWHQPRPRGVRARPAPPSLNCNL